MQMAHDYLMIPDPSEQARTYHTYHLEISPVYLGDYLIGGIPRCISNVMAHLGPVHLTNASSDLALVLQEDQS